MSKADQDRIGKIYIQSDTNQNSNSRKLEFLKYFEIVHSVEKQALGRNTWL